MEEKQQEKRSSTGVIWGVTIVVVLVIVVWLTGGFDALFGTNEGTELVAAEETPAKAEPAPEPAPEPKKPAAAARTTFKTVDVKGSEFYLDTDVPPGLVGGSEALAERVVYPEQAKEAGVEGRVFVNTYLDEKGNVLYTDVAKGIGMGCDTAARRAVQESLFTPAQVGIKPVKAMVTVPVTFKLDQKKPM